jgi:hypothetical protein
MKHASERSEPEKKKIEHGPELYQNHGRTLQQVTDSTVGQSFGEAQDSLYIVHHVFSQFLVSFQDFAHWTRSSRNTEKSTGNPEEGPRLTETVRALS